MWIIIHLESLKENYDNLPPDHAAAAKYDAQQKEVERTLQLLRSQSTHPQPLC